MRRVRASYRRASGPHRGHATRLRAQWIAEVSRRSRSRISSACAATTWTRMPISTNSLRDRVVRQIPPALPESLHRSSRQPSAPVRQSAALLLRLPRDGAPPPRRPWAFGKAGRRSLPLHAPANRPATPAWSSRTPGARFLLGQSGAAAGTSREACGGGTSTAGETLGPAQHSGWFRPAHQRRVGSVARF